MGEVANVFFWKQKLKFHKQKWEMCKAGHIDFRIESSRIREGPLLVLKICGHLSCLDGKHLELHSLVIF